MPISYGLTLQELELRANSTGASETRIIVNGNDEDLEQLWRLKRGEIDAQQWAEECADNIHMQFGHYVEALHREFFERRAMLPVTRIQEHVTHPDYPGLHVTLDGWVDGLPPHELPNPAGDFDFSWGCAKPSGPVPATVEFKWRNARVYSDEGQIRVFMPQVQQGMALTGAHYAILSTLTGDLVIKPHVIPFDRFYWAECYARVLAFNEAVATGSPPPKFAKLDEPEGLTVKKSVYREFDLTQLKEANIIGAYAGSLAENWPTEEERNRARAAKKAQDEIKKIIPKDASPVKGFGLEGKRNKAGSLQIAPTDEAVKEAHIRLGLIEASAQERDVA